MICSDFHVLFLPMLIDRKTVLASLAYLCLVFIACKSDPKVGASGPGGAPQGGPRVVSVDGFLAVPSRLERSVEATGNLIPNEAVAIRSERSGRLVQLQITESARVQSGQLLAKIDDSELRAQREKQLIRKAFLEKELERDKELVKIQALPQEQVDLKVNEIDQIAADIKLLDIQIRKSVIAAPFSGLVGLRQVSPGAYITPSDVLVEIQQIDPIKLEFDIPEKYISEVKIGQDVSFEVTGSNEQYSAKVYALSTEVASDTRTFKVRATTTNKDLKLKPGMFTRVRLITAISEQVVMVPTDAVVPTLEGQQVFVIMNGKAAARPVITGDRKEAYLEISSGLNVGDTVVVTGLMGISEGTAIKITRVTEPVKPTKPS